jgi:hypothetical protein
MSETKKDKDCINVCQHIMGGNSKRKGELCGKKILQFDRCSIHSKNNISTTTTSNSTSVSSFRFISSKCPRHLYFNFSQPAKPYILHEDWWNKTKKISIQDCSFTVHRSTNLILKQSNPPICIGLFYDSKPYSVSSFHDQIKKWCTLSGLKLETQDSEPK